MVADHHAQHPGGAGAQDGAGVGAGCGVERLGGVGVVGDVVEGAPVVLEHGVLVVFLEGHARLPSGCGYARAGWPAWARPGCCPAPGARMTRVDRGAYAAQ
jgi:hypothetical protein